MESITAYYSLFKKKNLPNFRHRLKFPGPPPLRRLQTHAEFFKSFKSLYLTSTHYDWSLLFSEGMCKFIFFSFLGAS